MMKPLYTVTYRYTRQLIHSFSRIHLWYHRRQHPLFLKTPGVFLAGCLLWRLYVLLKAGAGISFSDGLTLILIAAFTFLMLWMGFVHPYVFERTLQRNLEGPAGESITLTFYEDHIHAESKLVHADYAYEQVESGYVTTGCIYLYVNGDQALLVPFESMSGQDSRGFQRFLAKKLPCKLSMKTQIT